MIRWNEPRVIIEKNGLVFVAFAIILFYWALDIITGGRPVSRILITISIFAYGIFIQFLINAQKAAKDSLRQTHDELERTNEKLELAYAWMRDNRDKLKQQMYEEDIGFLIDQDGRIEGVTERALVVMKKSRDAFMGTNLTRLMPENVCEDSVRELRQAWKGMTQRLKMRIIMPEGAEKEFEIKFTHLTVLGKRLLLVILN